MISNDELEQKLKQCPGVDYVKVRGDGYHYQLTLVSDALIGKSKIARQKWVYALLRDEITDGILHALTMQTWTKEEWEKQCG